MAASGGFFIPGNGLAIVFVKLIMRAQLKLRADIAGAGAAFGVLQGFAGERAQVLRF